MVRLAVAFVCLVAACSRGDRGSSTAGHDTATAITARVSSNEPDALMLRVPRAGGVARVVAFPDVDSTVWTSNDALPPIEHVLGFDADAGLLAAENTHGQALWVDLRMGTTLIPTRKTVKDLVSVDGSTIFGVGADGAVVRFTPSGNWVFKPKQPAREVFPQPDGTALALTGRGASATLLRVRPPEIEATDSMAIGDVRVGTGAPLGDRIYFTTGQRTLVGVRARTLEKGDPIALGHSVLAIAATPSGDRFYVITDSSSSLLVIDRYQDRVTAEVKLPGRARALRLDPVGRFILVRPNAGDSAWVVRVGTDKLLRTVKTTWRSDLPLVAPDGSIAVVDGKDVVFIDPQSGREVHRAADGALDFWYGFSWSGFRAPPTTPTSVAATPPDTTDTLTRASGSVVRTDTVAAPPKVAPVDSAKLGFTLSFAALLDQAKARQQAAKIVVEGQAARVVPTSLDGTPVYRVVLGPYATRDEADRIGRESGLSYYVYAGPP